MNNKTVMSYATKAVIKDTNDETKAYAAITKATAAVTKTKIDKLKSKAQ
ncbi:MAG: hypothetical protein SFH39_00135 [Candidatus Magnetobacterium sp. LHC-1]